MSTMLVYRVETSNGKGPYNGFNAWDLTIAQMARHGEMSSSHANPKTHPTPQADRSWRLNPKSQDFGDRHLFAFASRADLVAWFGGWGVHLQDCGYRVGVYRAPVAEVIAGRNQVAVNRDYMEPVRQYPAGKLIP
ncbi:hypothetical protein [Micromonospora sp. NPDC049240]|uniref:hypothetical protein n=1 Tax=Micromonospora sp. NPDC049240 TaxID=3155151 RepID=UPI0033FB739B